jgi:hypothetical protein
MAAEMITTLPVKTKPGEAVKIVSDQLPASLTEQGNLKVALMEGQVNVTLAEKGFSNASDTPTRALVDADRHVQTDVLSFPVTKGDWLSVLPNPSNLDVALSTRASEATLSALKNALASVGTDKVRVSLIDALPAGTNTIGTVNAVKSGTWNIDNLLNPHPVKFTPEEKMQDANQFTGTYAPTAAGSTTIISAVTGKVIRVYDFYLWNSGTADVGVRLYFGTSGKNVFKGKLTPKTGVVKSFVRPWESNAGDSLVLYLDAAGTVDYGVGAVQA